jgi:RimJ/RimL family protein N-acetyltransferase
MTDQYPLELDLKDKNKLICRPVKTDDMEELQKFFTKFPTIDLQIFKDDVIKDERIENWFIYSFNKKLKQLAIFKNKEIIAVGTLHSEGIYWQNTGEIKLLVDPGHRRKNIGSKMFNILLNEGLKNGIQKLIIRYTSDNTSIIKILQNYGFNPEVTLNYYLEDNEKSIHRDLIIASLNIQDWKRRFEFYRAFFN